MTPFAPSGLLRLGCLLAMLVLTACDDTFIDPFDNGARYYTVYGFLDVQEQQHQLRIVPVTRTPERITEPDGADRELDAEVTTTDLVTGVVTTWTHHLERLEDGSYGHIFRATFRPEPNHMYRLVIERSDGKKTIAETRVPYFPNPTIFELAPLEVQNDTSAVLQSVRLTGIASPWEIQTIYLMENATTYSGDASEGTLHGRFFVPYGRQGHRATDGTWTFTVDMVADHARIRAELARYRAEGVYDNSPDAATSFGVQVRVLDQNWDPPEGIFDPEVLAQPGTLSNVENGYGLFGSIGLFRQEWHLNEDVARLLGYTWYPPSER